SHLVPHLRGDGARLYQARAHILDELLNGPHLLRGELPGGERAAGHRVLQHVVQQALGLQRLRADRRAPVVNVGRRRHLERLVAHLPDRPCGVVDAVQLVEQVLQLVAQRIQFGTKYIFLARQQRSGRAWGGHVKGWLELVCQPLHRLVHVHLVLLDELRPLRLYVTWRLVELGALVAVQHGDRFLKRRYPQRLARAWFLWPTPATTRYNNISPRLRARAELSLQFSVLLV